MKTDVQIQEDVLAELKWDSRLEVTDVGVEVHKGVVTLTGTVNTYLKRIAAQEAAHRVHGVLDVANDIAVKLPGTGAPTDTEIAQAARQSLVWDVLVPEEQIQTTVSDGWVTLKGEVDRWSQHEDAERVIRHLKGVRGITNLIKVRGPHIEAVRVRDVIEDALERRADREADRIGIAVSNGTVSLTGTVRSWMEKRAVLGAAEHAPGVQAVEDHLTVNPYS